VIPQAGVRSLFLACLSPDQPQFRGIRQALTELGSAERCCALQWEGSALRLRRRRALARVLITGHGLEARAGFAGLAAAGGAGFGPETVALPGSCSLYLAACFQGRADLRAAWAQGAGVPLHNVHGSSGETESALSSCLLLHLLEEGPERLERWFPAWQQANDALRPHFPRIRKSYQDNDGDPVRTLDELSGLARETGVEEFVSVVRRHPRYLTGLR